MDAAKLTAIASLIAAQSVATERLVEIIKGLVPWFQRGDNTTEQESRRRAAIHTLAAVCGVAVAFLTRDHVPPELAGMSNDTWGLVALGSLASGGSSFWNSVLNWSRNLQYK